jgi:hypothetical protein
MSHLKYHNNLVDVINTFYDSHLDLIRNICNDLGQPDKIKEMEEKYLDNTTKLKAKKDPLKPKRPKSSYLFFCEEKRKELMAKNPEDNISAISKKLGEMWKTVDHQVYIDRANDEKQRYKTAIDNYKF